jgi:hypothetical protein
MAAHRQPACGGGQGLSVQVQVCHPDESGVSEPAHDVRHDTNDGLMYAYVDDHWEFWSTQGNLVGVYEKWADVLIDFPELSA